jgi:hypothetical protein
MARFDLTSFFATISFFASIMLFLKESLSFFDFLQFLLWLEGVVFLAGAISNAENKKESGYNSKKISIWKVIQKKAISSPARINQIRYFFGLFFLFSGSFIDKLRAI